MAKYEADKYFMEGFLRGQKQRQEEEEFKKTLAQNERQISLLDRYRQDTLAHQKAVDFTTVKEGDEYNKDYGIDAGVYPTSTIPHLLRTGSSSDKEKFYIKPHTMDGVKGAGEFSLLDNRLVDFKPYPKDTDGRDRQEEKEKAAEKLMGEMAQNVTEILEGDYSEDEVVERRAKVDKAGKSLLERMGLESKAEEVRKLRRKGKTTSEAIKELGYSGKDAGRLKSYFWYKADVYDKYSNETAKDVKVLMNDYGITSDEAINLINKDSKGSIDEEQSRWIKKQISKWEAANKNKK